MEPFIAIQFQPHTILANRALNVESPGFVPGLGPSSSNSNIHNGKTRIAHNVYKAHLAPEPDG